jgi:hypothetical protein
MVTWPDGVPGGIGSSPEAAERAIRKTINAIFLSIFTLFFFLGDI